MRLRQLSAQIELNILVSSWETAVWLAKNEPTPLNCFVELDTGYGRTGLKSNDHPAIRAVLDILHASPTSSKASSTTRATPTPPKARLKLRQFFNPI